MRYKLKGIKTDMKVEEKIEKDDYLELKKAYKDLRGQIKYMEEECREDLEQDDHYNQLRKLKMEKEEAIALAKQKLFENIDKLPAKAFEMAIETEEGRVKMQVLPDMRVFVNGKEEKKVL